MKEGCHDGASHLLAKLVLVHLPAGPAQLGLRVVLHNGSSFQKGFCAEAILSRVWLYVCPESGGQLPVTTDHAPC